MSEADEPLYGDLTFSHTHPAHLAAVAALCGVAAPPVETCRVLELACGTGFNLLAMGHSLPRATLVGVDLSAKQIAHGTAAATAMGTPNVELRTGRLEDVADGEFDYVIAHGALSWVPTDVQHALLRVVRDRLSPTGLAFVSYNCRPGWRTRSVLRDLLRAVAPAGPAGGRVRRAKEAARRVIDTLPDPTGEYANTLRRDLDALAGQPDYYVLSDYLGDHNRPFLFTEFAALAAEHGLRHAAEADYRKNSFVQSGGEAAALNPAGDDVTAREQLLDFRRDRDFRQSILCHAGRPVPRWPDAAAVRKLWVASQVRMAEPLGAVDGPTDAIRSVGGGPVHQLRDPLFRTFVRRLHAAPGHKLPAESLLADLPEADLPLGPAMAPGLLAAVLAKGTAAGLWAVLAADPPFATAPGDRPRACPFARHAAAVGPAVTNRFHLQTELSEPDRAVLLKLDGTATRDELAAALGVSRAEVDASIGRLAAAAVLER